MYKNEVSLIVTREPELVESQPVDGMKHHIGVVKVLVKEF